MYKADQIASYFLEKYGAIGNITPMKLIKLVYISHGWYLGLTDQALIAENPEAWKYGPVIPSLYQRFKIYKNNPIIWTNNPNYSTGNPSLDQFLDRIWSVYGQYSGTELSAKTHMPGTPWDKTWNDLKKQNRSSLQISDFDIKNHYKQLSINNG